MPYHINNRKNMRHLNGLKTRREKIEYMVGGRVTVARITQVAENSLVHCYAAKIRGIVIGNDDEWLFDTPEQARNYGHRVMAKWRAELSSAQPNTRLQRTASPSARRR